MLQQVIHKLLTNKQRTSNYSTFIICVIYNNLRKQFENKRLFFKEITVSNANILNFQWTSDFSDQLLRCVDRGDFFQI